MTAIYHDELVQGSDEIEFAQTVTDEERFDLEAAINQAEWLRDDFTAEQFAEYERTLK